MNQKPVIRKIIADYHSKPPKKWIERNLQLPLDINKIVTVTGPRRSGKSATLELMAQSLKFSGIKPTQILYINFEDERLNIRQQDLDTLLQVFAEMYPNQDLSTCYFLFDEIQNVEGWEKFVRRVYDSVSYHVYITGSNSKLLSTEIATELRGRTLTFELLTLSFNEYLRFKKFENDQQDTASLAKNQSYFMQFVQEGGFPEVALLPETFHKNMLQDYFNVMMYRDMVERYNFTNLSVLKYFLKRMYESVGKPLSVNKIYHDLKSQNYNVSKNSLYEFLEAAQAIYMCVEANKFHASILKQELSEKKYYAIDNGLLQALTYDFKDNFGLLFENMIFLELRKYGYKCYYYKDKKECDLVIQLPNGDLLPAQVCFDISNTDTAKREYAGLLEACKAVGAREGLIFTESHENTLNIDGTNIQIVNAALFFRGRTIEL